MKSLDLINHKCLDYDVSEPLFEGIAGNENYGF